MATTAYFRFNKPAVEYFKQRNIRPWANRLANSVHDNARKMAPEWSGELKASIQKPFVHYDGQNFHVEIRCTAEHAVFVHNGTVPHKIRVVRAKVLTDVNQAPWGGRAHPNFFGKEVNHPGTRANPFLREALNLALTRRGLRPTGHGGFD